eukprot:3358529-Prymnesium_polylepis.4
MEACQAGSIGAIEGHYTSHFVSQGIPRALGESKAAAWSVTGASERDGSRVVARRPRPRLGSGIAY